MEQSLQDFVRTDEYSDWHEGGEIRTIADDAGLKALLFEMPNGHHGWMIDGITPDHVGNNDVAGVLRRLGDASRAHLATVFVVVDNFTFNDQEGISVEPSGARSTEHQRLRDWLVGEIGWRVLGKTQIGFGEMIGVEPATVD